MKGSYKILTVYALVISVIIFVIQAVSCKTNAGNDDDSNNADYVSNPARVLSFDDNGGSGGPQALTGGVTYTIPGGPSSASGTSVFAGWNTKRDGAGRFHEAGTLVTLTEDTILYALWSGDGADESRPVIITDISGLKTVDGSGTFGKIPRDGAYYVLANDITIDERWKPLGNAPFNGSFDGKGHKITFTKKSFDADMSDVGLFKFAYPGALIKNLVVDGKISGFTISGGSSNVGAIVAQMMSGPPGDNAVIENCAVHADIEWVSGINGYFGGIAGVQNGRTEIRNTYFDGTISVSSNMTCEIGGIVGESQGLIENCYSDTAILRRGNTSYSRKLGGIAGRGYSQTTKFCWSRAEISDGEGSETSVSNTTDIAGILGESYGAAVENCIVFAGALKVLQSAGNAYSSRVGGGTGTAGFMNNYAEDTFTLNGSPFGLANAGIDKKDGEPVPKTNLESESWWRNTADWKDRFGVTSNAPWKWDSVKKRPELSRKP